MWLLDNNLPRHIVSILGVYSIKSETARDCGWDRLRNGELVGAASKAGFTCILTKDGLFQSDASKALRENPHMAIVLITLPQIPGRRYTEAFKKAWLANCSSRGATSPLAIGLPYRYLHRNCQTGNIGESTWVRRTALREAASQ